MSMDDPGWGEEVPEDSSPAAVRAPKAPKATQSGIFQPTRTQLIIGGVIVLVVIVVVAILLSSGAKKPTSSTTTTTHAVTSTTHAATTTTAAGESIAQAGTAYLALETPAYNSLTAFSSTVSGWDSNPPTASAAQAAANPTITEFKNFSTKLLAGTWPSAVQSQINTLASQVEVVANDLGGLDLAFSQGNQSAWASQFETDANTLVTDVNAVRATLNLPALATS
jgi:hypothetical protein